MNKLLIISAFLIGYSSLAFASLDRLPTVEDDSCLAIAYKKYLDKSATQ